MEVEYLKGPPLCKRGQALYGRLRSADCIRAVPKTEISPAMRGIFIFKLYA